MASISWLPVEEDSPFSLANIPFGIVSSTGRQIEASVAVALGKYVVLLPALADGGALSQCPEIQPYIGSLRQSTLNDFASLGRGVHRACRSYLQDLFRADTSNPEKLRDNQDLRAVAIVPADECMPHLPMSIGDYTDFYVGLNHARNVGTLFRGAQNALQPNYTHLPVAYHGRASSIRPSGYPIRRPRGQILPQLGATAPVFSPAKKLDIELELGAFLCKGNGPDGEPIAIEEAGSYIFGYVLMNDWSARDIQAWEYVPLGPFNSKNFATTISPWVVLADALEPWRCKSALKSELKGSQVLPYLDEKDALSFHDITLTVTLGWESGGQRQYADITRTNASMLLFSFPQMLAHHAAGGCEMRVGDLLGSGTISGETTESMGSLLEMTENGKNPIDFRGGGQGEQLKVKRTFLQDGDEVVLSGYAGKFGSWIGFGECRGIILPPLETSL